MFRTFLSRRYLRARRTNWIGMAGITVAVAALILILSIMSGFLEVSRGHLRGTLSDVVVLPQLDLPLDDGSPVKRDAAGIREVLEADPLVAAASPQYNWFGMLMVPGRERLASDPTWGNLSIVRILGVDPEAEFAVSEMRDYLEAPIRSFAGAPVEDVDDPFRIPDHVTFDGRPHAGVVVGEQLADIWGLKVGEELELVSATFDTGEPDPSKLKLRVVGTFRSGNNEFDMGAVYVAREEMKDWVGHGREYTQVTVRLHDYEGTRDDVKVALAGRLHEAAYAHDYDPLGPRGEVRLWEDFQVNMLKAIENEKTLLGIMLSLVLLVAAFTVFAILSMMVTEKRRDIGILSALGATPRGVLGLFLMIGFWEAFVGSVVGGTLGILGALNINAIERNLSDLLGVQIFNKNVYLLDHIPTVIELDGILLIVVGAFVASLVAAAFPAWRAARLDPVEALRHE